MAPDNSDTSYGLSWRYRILAWLLRNYLRLLWYTGRWDVEIPKKTADHINAGQPVIALFWHGRLFMMPKAKPADYPLNMLLSRNHIASLTAFIIKDFNVKAIRGSSANHQKPHRPKGGSTGLRGLLRCLERGEAVGITPDGPRGPAQKLSKSTILLARLSGRPLLPVTFSARWYVKRKSWDHMHIPLPFTKGRIVMGELIYIPSKIDPEAQEVLRQNVETIMNNLTHTTDTAMQLD